MPQVSITSNEALVPPTIVTHSIVPSSREVSTLEHVVRTNVFGAFATVQAFYPLLKVCKPVANAVEPI